MSQLRQVPDKRAYRTNETTNGPGPREGTEAAPSQLDGTRMAGPAPPKSAVTFDSIPCHLRWLDTGESQYVRPTSPGFSMARSDTDNAGLFAYLSRDVMKMVKSERQQRVLRSATQCLVGTLALALLTFICFRLRLNLATEALLYLIVVVLLALAGDFVSSIVVSIIAALCLPYLTPPINSFRIDDPKDVVAIVAFFITSLIIIGLLYKVRKLANEVLASVRCQLVETEERERRRIARHLYDDICQRLTLLVVRLQELNRCDSTAIQGIDELREQASEIATDVQALAHELHFAKLEYLGLAASMRSFCREFSEQQRVEIDFSNDDLLTPLPSNISTCLFRILQEALHNAANHSRMEHFEVELRRAPDAIHLIVRDWGLGFDRREQRKSGGLGLVSMQERLKLVNGKLAIDSQLKRGTTIHACVPLSSLTGSIRANAKTPMPD